MVAVDFRARASLLNEVKLQTDTEQLGLFQIFRAGASFTVDHPLNPGISKKEPGRWVGQFDTPPD
jgi:hypothetical protein